MVDFVTDLGPGAIAGTRFQAAECDVVILAVHWVKVREALKGIDWRGRVLIDATNAHMDAKPDISLAGVTRSRAALKGRTPSEMVAEMAVRARLVKSISNMPMAWIQDFSLMPTSPSKPLHSPSSDPSTCALWRRIFRSSSYSTTASLSPSISTTLRQHDRSLLVHRRSELEAASR